MFISTSASSSELEAELSTMESPPAPAGSRAPAPLQPLQAHSAPASTAANPRGSQEGWRGGGLLEGRVRTTQNHSWGGGSFIMHNKRQ